MQTEKQFVWSPGQILLMLVAITGFFIRLLSPSVGWWLLGLAILLTVVAIYFSGRDLAKAQNEAARTGNLLIRIGTAVRATDATPVGLREEVTALVGSLWWAVIELYKTENVPAPVWSSNMMADFAELSNGYQLAFNRTLAFTTGADFLAVQQQYINVRSHLFTLKLADGRYLLTQEEMRTLQNMATQKEDLEQQARALQYIIPRIGSSPEPSAGRQRWWLLWRR